MHKVQGSPDSGDFRDFISDKQNHDCSETEYRSDSAVCSHLQITAAHRTLSLSFSPKYLSRTSVPRNYIRINNTWELCRLMDNAYSSSSPEAHGSHLLGKPFGCSEQKHKRELGVIVLNLTFGCDGEAENNLAKRLSPGEVGSGSCCSLWQLCRVVQRESCKAQALTTQGHQAHNAERSRFEAEKQIYQISHFRFKMWNTPIARSVNSLEGKK